MPSSSRAGAFDRQPCTAMERLSGETLAQVTDAVVKTWAAKHGQGPISAKTYQNDDLVFTVLRKSLTPQERTLLGDGQDELVRRVRSAFEQALRHEYMSTVGEITGREVIDYHSQVLLVAELTVEVFVLRDG